MTAVDDAVADVLAVVDSQATRVDRDATFPEESVNALRHSGLMGLLVPEEHGGLGGDLRDMVRVAQRLAGGCLSTALIWVMHCQQVHTVVRFGGVRLQDRLLPAVAAGESYLASVTTEETGGQLMSAGEALVTVEGGYALSRTAPMVTGGRHADGFLIKMRSTPDAPAQDVSLVYADRGQLEIEVGDGWQALGMRGAENVAMTLRGTVPAWQVVNGLGGFRRIAVEAFAPTAHLGWSAAWLGAARAGFAGLLRELRSGTGTRVDLRSDLVGHRIARIRCQLEAVGGYLHGVLDEVTAIHARGGLLGQPATQIHLNTLKVLAAEQTYSAVDAMIALAGLRTGYLRDSPVPLERLLRDLRSASLNYDDSRLLAANGMLCLLDSEVTVLGSHQSPAG